ncbi:MAG: FAD-dependent oxidoreductase [Phycisphaerae bacterium]|nr:FAD-dependent oxidoreductase [Phycisphaerae bacterium]
MEHRHAKVVVIGAGPAGLAAAARAGEHGCSVLVIDDNPDSGGQIWRGDHGLRARTWRARCAAAGVAFVHETAVIGESAPGTLVAGRPRGPMRVRFERLVLATGARELFLPFPGWTLPGVFGAGGLQALVKSGFDVRGMVIPVVGSGPLLPVIAAYLRGRGARVPIVAEQASAASMRGLATGLLGAPAKLIQAIRLRAALWRTPYRTGYWPVQATGEDRVREVKVSNGQRTLTIACDALACGFGLVPNIHVASTLGCHITEGRVDVSDLMRTSREGVFAAGEALGVGGVECALVEGEIAGLAAAGAEDEAADLRGRRARARAFAGALSDAFRLREELRRVVDDATVVCRCEDVRWGRVRARSCWRDAKLQTRCGMGPCQGRVCGPAMAFLRGWRVGDSRPPVYPAGAKDLAVALGSAGASAAPDERGLRERTNMEPER